MSQTVSKPDFIIIGAAKSGTTTIYEYLASHPDIYLSTPKEPDFFALDQIYEQGLDYYQSLFAPAKPGQIRGEASTTYSRLQQHPHTVERMHQLLPDVKLIFIMRHPVERAYSFYTHRFKGSMVNPDRLAQRNELMTAKTFEEAIAQTTEFIDSSYYLYQIEKYLEYYPRESFLFLFMEDLIASPQKSISQILEFLGLGVPEDFFIGDKIVANQRQDYPQWYVKQQFASSLKQNPVMSKALKLIPQNWKNFAYQKWKNNSYRDWQKKQTQYLPPPMLLETRRMLLEKFAQPNQQLAEFLGKDLSHWNK